MALNLLNRFKLAWKGLTYRAADPVSDLRHPTAWLQSWALGGPTIAGLSVSPHSALTLSAYFAAVRAISEDVGKLPLKVYERLERGKHPATDHWSYPILHDAPNENMGSMSFREAMTFNVLTWGNAYAQILTDGRNIQGISRPIHPSRVQPRFDDNLRLYYRIHVGDIMTPSDRAPKTATIELPQDEVFHLRGPGGDGITGYSIAQLGAESIGLSLAAQMFGASFFGNGASLGGVLTHPQHLDEIAQKNLRESWQSVYGGSMNSGKVAILEEGMKYERVGIPPEDAQFLETRQFQVTEIARWFRIPPHKIAYLENATFTNIEHQSLEYVTDTLMPWLVRWEQEIKRKFFMDEPDFFAEHVVLGLLRGDQAARANFYREMVNIGAYSPNMVLEEENMNPIEGPEGDEHYMQMNMTTLKKIAAAEEPPASEPMPPEADDDEEPIESDPVGAFYQNGTSHVFEDN